MKDSSEKAIEVNNVLRVNVDEQQDDIKQLKEQCDKDNKDKVHEITAAITPMKKKNPVCVTCNHTLVTQKKVEKTYPGRAH